VIFYRAQVYSFGKLLAIVDFSAPGPVTPFGAQSYCEAALGVNLGPYCIELNRLSGTDRSRRRDGAAGAAEPAGR
jgi:hypothetical protein